jgi:hypothetical protein
LLRIACSPNVRMQAQKMTMLWNTPITRETANVLVLKYALCRDR